eukprot:8050727-Pyramimonas_sp.AAC.1
MVYPCRMSRRVGRARRAFHLRPPHQCLILKLDICNNCTAGGRVVFNTWLRACAPRTLVSTTGRSFTDRGRLVFHVCPSP